MQTLLGPQMLPRVALLGIVWDRGSGVLQDRALGPRGAGDSQ